MAISSLQKRSLLPWILFLLFSILTLFTAPTLASVGDRLPEFRQCVEICKTENCLPSNPTPIPLHRRLLLWTCPQECDYTCQHIITARRVSNNEAVVQFHGKWPFYRLLGMQEPFSVVFSLGNFWAHYDGLHNHVLKKIPKSYTMRPYYVWLARIGMASWFFSAVFHTRDFRVTEELDYFAAGASVLYGMYYTMVRVFRLDRPDRGSQRRLWTTVCAGLYLMHVGYLKGVGWDYTYNMGANVVVGVVQNLIWSWFSVRRYYSKEGQKWWMVWPGLVVMWVVAAMSLELLDFAPVWGCLDAHSLWHLGTIGPAVVFYRFLVRDSEEVVRREGRLKA
ncbi:Per1-like-domain-containing protein [Apiosordaria backusii]|uniref:Post-GPI attachment to proteins factor 3 n=1 Tax=Apiosordaria backusii TaxID=314023 RepID=A0AA40EZ64_9PEZI|nr:Per1-like-domain-containing protein [Apiosordaria backusii]